jgi:hypothetical protein
MVTIKSFPLFSYKGKQEQLLVEIMTITYKKSRISPASILNFAFLKFVQG